MLHLHTVVRMLLQGRWLAGFALTACGSTGGGSPADAGRGGTAGQALGGSAEFGGMMSSDAGRGGTGGASGAGGVSGTAGDMPAGEHCQGGKTFGSGAANTFDKVCFGDPLELRIPNPAGQKVDGMILPGPMVPGEPSAASFTMKGFARGILELWGTDAQCGAAKELLWVGETANKIVCAQFTPSAAHTHLLYVLRHTESNGIGASVSWVGLCPTGTCSQPDGEGRTEATAPVSKQTEYESIVNYNFKGFDTKLGKYGRMIVFGEGRPAAGESQPITSGIFKAPTDLEPYGDAYYCIGAGSTWTENKADKSVDVSLTNVTRLGSCAELKGAGSLGMSWSDHEGHLTSSLPALTLNDDIVNGGCLDKQCYWSFVVPPKMLWVDYETVLDLGNSLLPTLVPSALTEAAVFNRESDTAPLELACGTTGTALYAPEGTTTLQVDDLGVLKACPGTPIVNSSVNLHLYQ